MKRLLLYSLIAIVFKIEAAEFVVFNVGQGNCNLFIPDQTLSGTQGKGIPVLFDAGSDHYPETLVGVKIDKSTVVDEIVSTTEAEIKKIIQNITANLPNVGTLALNVIVSHAHTDHYSYILSILSKLPKTAIFNFYFGGCEKQYPKKFVEEIKKYRLRDDPYFILLTIQQRALQPLALRMIVNTCRGL